MPDDRPILAWLRRDLRLGDHPMLSAAADSGRPVIPVFVFDEVVEANGTAPVWRLGKSVGDMAARLKEIGSRLVLRRGRAANVLKALVEESGAADIWWTRAYDPEALARDDAVEKLAIDTQVFGGHLLFEPWEVATQAGDEYKVYTPFWRAVKGNDVATPLAAVRELRAPETWPDSDDLGDWRMGAGMRRGAAVVEPHLVVGEASATSRLAAFTGHRIAEYERMRDLPAEEGTSGLSENLTYGEISIRSCWHAGQRAREEGKAGAETWLKELVWREFAYHLIWHTPRLITGNWREEWDAFPWRGDNGDAKAWRRGRTGIPFVDAAMREMYVTGRMHNRARMIVASYLTKHLMTHWRIGHDWFVDCLVDWDPANNALGWQWSSGSGPDATPYFRVFNPVTQREKFDPDGAYVRRWIAEGRIATDEDGAQLFRRRAGELGAAAGGPVPGTGGRCPGGAGARARSLRGSGLLGRAASPFGSGRFRRCEVASQPPVARSDTPARRHEARTAIERRQLATRGNRLHRDGCGRALSQRKALPRPGLPPSFFGIRGRGAVVQPLTTTEGQADLPRYFAPVFATACRMEAGRLDFVLSDGRRFRAEGRGPVRSPNCTYTTPTFSPG